MTASTPILHLGQVLTPEHATLVLTGVAPQVRVFCLGTPEPAVIALLAGTPGLDVAVMPSGALLVVTSTAPSLDQGVVPDGATLTVAGGPAPELLLTGGSFFWYWPI